MSQQQTILRAQSNKENSDGIIEYIVLDLYSDVPIKINKSFAELQNISVKNSDYSIGLTLPGSKRNNQFFETFYNVDSTSLYFNANNRTNIDVLLNGESYFRGYLRLNKVNVINSQTEYDVTLYSEVGNLFGEIGNGLLTDLNFDDEEYTFNHTFSFSGVTQLFYYSNFYLNQEKPYPYFYPIVHNGYNYYQSSGATLPFVSGSPIGDQTRLYTSTSPISAWTTTTAAYAAGVKEYYINSPLTGLRDNQLKPALNIYSLLQLMFKDKGYKIESNFFNTPWFKTLYLYGYYSSEATKFSYKLTNIESLPIEGCEIVFAQSGTGDTGNAIVTKKGTGIPCYCLTDINVTMIWYKIPLPIYFHSYVIPAGTSGVTDSVATYTFDATNSQSSNCSVGTPESQKYYPKAVGQGVPFSDGDFVNFSLVIDQNIKQIDLLSSIAKKFNLVFIPDPIRQNVIKIEPYDFYVGTGNLYDWTPKLSWDKGFSVEPALNYVESQLTLTDLEDGDEGNKQYKTRNKYVYGQNIVYNPTDFKSQEKSIETIFSPELVRKWDNNIGLPLGINYAASSEISEADNQVRWIYNGVKSKPKLMYWLGGFNPFLDSVGEVYNLTYSYNTYTVKIIPSNYTGVSVNSYNIIPTISHTMPMGLSDSDKINNDSICVLFNSEYPIDIGVQTYNTYTENDAYNTFYKNRITNIYNPNTRFVSGYFDLKYSDVQNLKPNDIIKINEQFFTWNKIQEYNLTNRELTKVELIQLNVNPQKYPTRYFSYYYCDNPSKCFKLKTDFTNPNLRDTNYAWSIYYDHQVGSLSGSTTGFTSTIYDFNTGSFRVEYTPYSMQEITQESFESGSCIDWNYDTLMNHRKNNDYLLTFRSFWESSGNTGANVWENCSDFYSAATTYHIITGSSTTYGPALTPTPTPTPSPTSTPILSTRLRGSLLLSYDLINSETNNPYLEVFINNEIRKVDYNDVLKLYTTDIYDGDLVKISLITNSDNNIIDIFRREYTADDNGDNGIFDIFVTGATGSSISGVFELSCTVSVPSNNYNFEYLLNPKTVFPVTPTPTPSITPTNTPTPTLTSTPTLTPSITPSITPTNTPTPTTTPTPSYFIPNYNYVSGMTVFYDITNPSSYDQTNIIKNLIITYPYYTGTTFNNPSNFKENNIKFLHFNGINQNLLSNYVGYNTGNITISTWVRFKTTNLTYVYTRGNQPSPSVQSVQLVKSQVIPDQHMLFSIKGSIGTGSIVESSITTNINQWYFLTSVIDFTSGTIKLYINNTLFSHVISPYFNTLQNVTQGYNIASNSISTYSDIDFSQFIVYEKVLSNTEITNNFNNSKIYFGY